MGDDLKSEDNKSEDNNSEVSEYEEIDVTNEKLYQIFSAFLETEEGRNICDILEDIRDVMEDGVKLLSKLVKEKKSKKSAQEAD